AVRFELPFPGDEPRPDMDKIVYCNYLTKTLHHVMLNDYAPNMYVLCGGNGIGKSMALNIILMTQLKIGEQDIFLHIYEKHFIAILRNDGKIFGSKGTKQKPVVEIIKLMKGERELDRIRELYGSLCLSSTLYLFDPGP